MNHLSEEQLILHYYGEEGDALAVEQHLDECGDCRTFYGSLQRVLNVVDTLPVPDRGPEYGAEVWQKVSKQLPARRRWVFGMPAWRWAAAGVACAGLMVAAFVAGRFYQHTPKPLALAKTESSSGEKVLLVAVGDYLERSQMVLIELANANPQASMDVSAEQERAGDLVSEGRLYRQTAAHTGNTAVSGLLDEIDRVMMDIAHGPSELSPEDLGRIRQRLEADGILLKIRVLGSNVRDHEGPVAKTARTKTISEGKTNMTRKLTTIGCLIAAASLALAQDAPPAPPASPAPAAAPAPQAAPAPPAPVPARAPRAFTLKGDQLVPLDMVDVNTLIENTTHIDVQSLIDQGMAMRLDSVEARELADQIRDGVKGVTIDGQKIKDLTDKLKDKTWTVPSPKWMAQAVPPAPPAPPMPAQGGRGMGQGVGIGAGRGVGGRTIISTGGRGATREDSLYENGKNSLDRNRFDDALSAFNEVLARGGVRVEGALYYKAYTLNKMGRRDEALAAIAELRKTYPNSRWLDDAKALEVEVKQASGKPVSPDELAQEDIKILALEGLMRTDPDKAFPMVEGLIKGSHSPKLKMDAVYVLALNQSPRAQTLLEQIARGTNVNPDVQLKAVSYLVDTRNKPARAQLLIEIYNSSSDMAVKRAILNSFNRSRDFEHLGQLMKTEKNSDLRDVLISNLGDVDGQPDLWPLFAAETTPEGKQKILRYMATNGNSEKLAEVARTDKDPSVRKYAVQILGYNKGVNTTNHLSAMYPGEQDASVKKQIVSVLADQKEVKPLIEICRKEKDAEMRKFIVQRLINIKSPEVNDFLMEILK